MPIYEIIKLKAPELERLDRLNTVFFFSVGTLEDHGPALPLSADGLEAEKLSQIVAEKILESDSTMNIVRFPTFHSGVDSATSKMGLRVRSHVLRDYLIDTCDGLTRLGFKKFVCFSGNMGPAHLTAIEEAGKFLRSKHMRFGLFGGKFAPTLVSASSVAISDDEKSENPIHHDPKEHAGKRDFEIAQILFPEYLDAAFDTLPDQQKNPSWFSRWINFRSGNLSGYWGSPSKADPKMGEERVRDKVSTILPKLKAVWSGSDPNHVFRSWYSIYPPNKSLFKAWVLVFGLIILMAAWIVMTLQTFLGGAEF